MMFLALPDILILKIIHYCDLLTRLRLERVSKRFKQLTEVVWAATKTVNIQRLFLWMATEKNLEECPRFSSILASLFDRCHSKLTVLYINVECDLLILSAVCQRFPHLKTLTLEKVHLSVSCYRTLKQFQVLEELTLKPGGGKTDFGVPGNSSEILTALKEAFASWKYLKKYSFSTASCHVVALICHLPITIIDLSIMTMCISGIGAESLRTFLRSHANLTRISLLTKNALDFLPFIGTCCRRLECLVLYTKFVQPLDLSMFSDLTEISLPSLWQSNNNVNVLFRTLYSCCNHLKVLRLTHGRFCTSETLAHLACLENLQVLDMTRTTTSEKFLHSLIDQCIRLKEIYVDLTDEQFDIDALLNLKSLRKIFLKNDGFVTCSAEEDENVLMCKSVKFISQLHGKLSARQLPGQRLNVFVEWSDKQARRYQHLLQSASTVTVVNLSSMWHSNEWFT